MKPIYDLAQKFAALAAFIKTDTLEAGIAEELFGYRMDGKSANEAFSKLKAASRNLSDEDRIRLSAHVNGIIAGATLPNDAKSTRGPIRPEDWDRPITDFFTDLENQCGAFSPQLDDAHSALVSALTAMDAFRDTSVPLALANDVGQSRERGRFPSTAVAVDTITLPTIQFRHGERMMIELTQPLNHAAQAWMFFIRNPDTRKTSSGVTSRIWTQKPENLIRWSVSPFMLGKGFSGPLPGFPCTVEPLDGEYTAYLLLETTDALGVRRCVETDMARVWNPKGPTYEATLHMISRVRTLFQRGNTGNLGYPPPTLLMRRYRIWSS